MKRLVLLGVALVTFALPVFGQPKYGVTSTSDKGTDFTKVKTYVWHSGWDAPAKAHEAILAAADRELKALGLEKKASGPSDAVIKYAALRRTDMPVSTKAVGSDAPKGALEVGSLLVVMTDPAGKELWRSRVDQPIDTDPAKLTETIDGAVKAVFEKYPTRAGKK